MRAQLCETVTGDTMAQLLAAREAAAGDMVELRLDGVRDLDVERALHGRRSPVIVTCRPAWEGGRFDGSEQARAAFLRRAIEAGADYVDIEWRALAQAERRLFDDLVQGHHEHVVISSHDFTGVPDDLCALARAMRAAGAAVIKIAVTVTRLSESLRLRDIAAEGDAVIIGMGNAGVPTRLLATRFRSRWTYGGPGVAPGQIPVSRMIGEFRFREITDQTAIYGVAGEDALQSQIPSARNAGFAAAGCDAVCVPLPSTDESDIAAFAEAFGILGWERCT